VSSFFALLSAALFACNALCVRLAVRSSSAATATLVSIATNFATLWLTAILSGSLSHLALGPALVFLLAGAFTPGLARLSYYEAITLIGITPASTITSSTPIFAAILAVPVLGERLSLRVALGTLLVAAGVWLSIRSPGTSSGPRSWAGVLLALNTALMAAISFILRKVGLRMLPDPLLASTITVTGSLAVLLPFLALQRRITPIRMDRSSLPWLIAGGLLTTGGFLSYFQALNLGEVVRVTPLSNTTPIFTVLLLRFFRKVETVGLAASLGAFLAVAGVMFVVTD